MPDYQINVVIEFAETDDGEARALADNTNRILCQYFPQHEVKVAVFGKPVDIFSRKVA